MRALRPLGATILACLAVVLLPSEAWGYTQPQVLGNGTHWSSLTVTPRSTDGRIDVNYVRPVSNAGVRGCFELLDGAVVPVDIAGSQGAYGAFTFTYPGTVNVIATGYGGVTGARVISSANPVTHARMWVRPSGVSTTWPTMSTSDACGDVTAPAGWVEVLYWGDSDGGSPPLSTCESFQVVLAGYQASPPALGLSFLWSGTVPAAGWLVRDGPLATSPFVTFVGKTYRAGENRFGFDSKSIPAALSSTTATLRLEPVGNPACYSLITLAAGVGPTIQPEGVPTDSDGGGCGFGDVACYLRAAFVPSQTTMAEFTDLRTRAATVIPLGYATGAVTALASLGEECSVGSGCAPDYVEGLCFSTGFLGSTGLGAGSDDVCPLTDETPAIVWLQSHRDWLSVIAWLAVLGPLVGFVFRRFLPFGGGGE